MKRPLPPELIVLGDQLEVAAARAVGQRPTRRQLVLNGLPSLAIAVPLAVALGSSVPPPSRAVAPVVGPGAPSLVRTAEDIPPRSLRRDRPKPEGVSPVAPSRPLGVPR